MRTCDLHCHDTNKQSVLPHKASTKEYLWDMRLHFKHYHPSAHRPADTLITFPALNHLTSLHCKPVSFLLWKKARGTAFHPVRRPVLQTRSVCVFGSVIGPSERFDSALLPHTHSLFLRYPVLILQISLHLASCYTHVCVCVWMTLAVSLNLVSCWPRWLFWCITGVLMSKNAV